MYEPFHPVLTVGHSGLDRENEIQKKSSKGITGNRLDGVLALEWHGSESSYNERICSWTTYAAHHEG